MTGSSANLTIRGHGIAGVDATVRLTPSSFIRCCIYQDGPPILALDDGPVHVAVTVPDPEHVTEDDLAAARYLAAEARKYVTELQGHVASPAREEETA